jgi:hypothetical protein
MVDLHAEAAARELRWLSAAITARIEAFFGDADAAVHLPDPPDCPRSSAYGSLVAEAGLDPPARLVLALALAPNVQPGLLDPFHVRNTAIDRPFSEFGGRIAGNGSGLLPTGEMALFLIAGSDPLARIAAMRLFEPDHPLRARGIVALDPAPPGAPPLAGGLRLGHDQVVHLTSGRTVRPDFAPDFPARRLTTRLTWEDLVLAPDVMDQIGHVAAWLRHERTILEDWDLGRTLKPGYRALFYGPPGTGKTLTAALLGQQAGLDCFRIDLSMVVSKYIGETEKNLAGVFDQAARRNWILFFDEADALFGARSNGASSNDRYANQEVAYLLQRIEDCPALVILATNLRSNMDDAFLRRFQSLVGFTRPDAEQRARLWRGGLAGVPLAADVAVEDLARDHELVGGAIVNVIRHAAISALRRGRSAVGQADFLHGIASETRKEGRTP